MRRARPPTFGGAPRFRYDKTTALKHTGRTGTDSATTDQAAESAAALRYSCLSEGSPKVVSSSTCSMECQGR